MSDKEANRKKILAEGNEQLSRSNARVESVGSSRFVSFKYGTLKAAQDALSKIMWFLAPGNDFISDEILHTTAKGRKFRWDYDETDEVKTYAEIRPTAGGDGYVLEVDKVFSDGTNFPQVIADIVGESPLATSVSASLEGETQDFDDLLTRAGMKSRIDSMLEYKVRKEFVHFLLSTLRSHSEKYVGENGKSGSWQVTDLETLPSVFREVYLSFDRPTRKKILIILLENISAHMTRNRETGSPSELSSGEKTTITKTVPDAIQMMLDLHNAGRINSGVYDSSMFAGIYSATLETFFEESNASTQMSILKTVFSILTKGADDEAERNYPDSIEFSNANRNFSAPTVYSYEQEMVLPSDPDVKASFSVTRAARLNLRTFDVSLGDYESCGVYASPVSQDSDIQQGQVLAGLSTIVGVSTEELEDLHRQSRQRKFSSPSVEKDFRTLDIISNLSER